MKDTANDMRREIHVTPTVRKVIVASVLLAVLAFGTCALIGPLAPPATPYDPVQRRAGGLFDVVPPEQQSSQLAPSSQSPSSQDTSSQTTDAPAPADAPQIAPADLGDARSGSGQAPPTVYTPPSAQ